jgi:hypothetical protein
LGLPIASVLLLGAIFMTALAISAHYLIERPSRHWIKGLGQAFTPHLMRMKVSADCLK